MQKREYKKVCWDDKQGDEQISAHLTELGQMGWKIVQADLARDDYLLERDTQQTDEE